MTAFLEKLERFVDRVIPYLIVLLIGVVIIDVFFHDTSITYATPLFILDSVIVGFFVVDLIFKYRRVRNIPRFLRLYWLDIMAVLPFFLILRLFEEVLLLSETSTSVLRNLFHTGLILEEEAAAGSEASKIAKTSEILAKEGRLALLSDVLKPLRRIPRFLKAFSFYEHPKKKKTLYHRKD